jgi:hypothetical protein
MAGSEFWHGNQCGGGYELNSIQLAMANTSGSPSGFTVMLYEDSDYPGNFSSIGNNLGTLDGPANPSTAGIYTYTPAVNLTLLPTTAYYIVLTSETAVANGAYEWSYGNYAGNNTYNQSGGWANLIDAYAPGLISASTDGLSWGEDTQGFFNPQFAINATAVPEPSSPFLLLLGSSIFIYARRAFHR